MTATVNTTEARVARLERVNRRLIALLTVVACGALVAAGPARSGDPGTGPIVLKDDQGRVRYRVEIAADGGIVQTFLDPAGVERIKTFVDADGAARQRFFDDAGKNRLGLFAGPAGHKDIPGMAGIGITDPSGKGGVYLQADSPGGARHFCTDTKGTVRVYGGVDPARIASHHLADEKGVSRVTSFTCPADSPDAPALAGSVLRGTDGKDRLSQLTYQDNSLAQFFMAPDGKVRFTSQVAGSGRSTFQVDPAAAEQVFAAAGVGRSVLEALRLLADK